ncbi:MAG: mechanosensitive ion channel family protein [Alphaproteobacteria bacterium]|nr:mechanosensitive ion channel family protein [Alphaproteobacteria bacterium]
MLAGVTARTQIFRRALALVLALVAFVLACDATAQVQRPQRPFTLIASGWERTLDRVGQEAGRPGATQAELTNLRVAIEEVQQGAIKIKEEGAARVATVRRLLDALGPAPGKDQPAEAEAVAGRRKALDEELAAAEGQVKQTELIIARSDRLLADITAARRLRLIELLKQRGPSLLSPSLWMTASVDFANALARVVEAPFAWYRADANSQRWRQSAPMLVATVAIVGFAAWPLRLWLLRRYGRQSGTAQPTYPRRVLASIVEAVCRGLLPALAAGAVLAVVLIEDLVSGMFQHALTVLVLALVKFLLVTGFARAALAPDMPDWRLAPFTDDSAGRINRRIMTLAGALLAYNFLIGIENRYPVGPELSQAAAFVFNGLIAAALVALVQRRNWQTKPAPPPVTELDEPVLPSRPSRLWPALRVAVTVIACAAPLAALIGFSELPWFLIGNLIDTLFMATLLLLVRGLVHDVMTVLLFEPTRASAFLRRTLDLDAALSRSLIFWLELVLDTLLWIAGLFFLLLQWGGDHESLFYFLAAAIKGVTVGKYTFSIVDIVFAAALFVAVLFGTRYAQRTLENRILPQTRLDAGMRHSVKAGVGYIGLILAFVVAVAAIGLDLSNLALIFGALSVGIGFGLQNIVNNFVSGLILLIERPIKVGDWVVVGTKEGTVRNIKVRATEIETFHKATIIIPNSEILSSAVVNWTHKDRMARIDIKVAIAYGADTRRVQQLLMDCARAHSQVALHPAPQVVLADLGANGLDFELRVFVNDVDYFNVVPTDLRMAIDAALRAAGIAMATARTDVHLVDIDRLAPGLARPQ